MTDKMRIEPVFAPDKNAAPFLLYIIGGSGGENGIGLTKLEVLKLINSGLNAIIGAERHQRTGQNFMKDVKD